MRSRRLPRSAPRHLACGLAALALTACEAATDGALVVSGMIETRTIEAGSRTGGRVAEVHIREGDDVVRGQPLVAFEDDFLAPQVEQGRADVETARAALDEVQAGPRSEQLERARAAWRNAESRRARLEPLVDPGYVTQQEYDDAATAAETELQTYEELVRGSRDEEVRQAAGRLVAAEKRLAYLEAQAREATVYAPRDGRVQTFDLRPGDLVQPGEPVVEILEPDQLYVRAYVPETELGRVFVGQTAEVEIDTYPDRAFPGRVVEISGRAEYTPRNVQTRAQREDQVFAIRVDVESAPELNPGMAATVRLIPAPARDAGTARPDSGSAGDR